MISKTSLKYYTLITRFGCLIRVIPYEYDKNYSKFRLINKQDNLISSWNLIFSLSMLARIGFISLFLASIKFRNDVGLMDVLITFVFVSAFLAAGPVHILYILKPKETLYHINTLIHLNQQAAYQLNCNPSNNEKDGLELVMMVMIFTAATGATAALPGTFFAYYWNLPMFRFLNILGYFTPGLFLCLALFLLLVVEWSVTLTEIFLGFLHFNSTSMWHSHLKKKWSTVPTHSTVKEKYRKLRLAFEVHHELMFDVHGYMVSYLIPIAELIIIACIISFVQFYSQLNPMIAAIIVCVGIFAHTGMKMCVQLMACVTENSKESAGPECYYLPVDKFKIYWKGRLLKVKMGDSIFITKETYLTIIQDIVLETVINFLVSFRFNR